MHIRTFVLQCLTVTICLITKSVVTLTMWKLELPHFQEDRFRHLALQNLKNCHMLFGPSFSDHPDICWNYIPRSVNIHRVVHSYSQCTEKSLTVSKLKKSGPPVHCCIFHHLIHNHINNGWSSSTSTKKPWQVPSFVIWGEFCLHFCRVCH